MKCSNCGEDIHPEASQCPSCRATFKSEQNKSLLAKIPSSFLGVLTGFIVLFIFVQLGSPVTAIGAAAILTIVVWLGGSYLR
jgi:hypothetical protein